MVRARPTLEGCDNVVGNVPDVNCLHIIMLPWQRADVHVPSAREMPAAVESAAGSETDGKDLAQLPVLETTRAPGHDVDDCEESTRRPRATL